MLCVVAYSCDEASLRCQASHITPGSPLTAADAQESSLGTDERYEAGGAGGFSTSVDRAESFFWTAVRSEGSVDVTFGLGLLALFYVLINNLVSCSVTNSTTVPSTDICTDVRQLPGRGPRDHPADQERRHLHHGARARLCPRDGSHLGPVAGHHPSGASSRPVPRLCSRNVGQPVQVCGLVVTQYDPTAAGACIRSPPISCSSSRSF